MKIYIGTSGYNYKQWQGIFYSENANSPEKMFREYTKFFNTVEINYSFYHTPKPSTVEKWYKKAPSDFYYTLKAPKLITHIKRFNKDSYNLIQNFNSLFHILKEKAGVVLYQLPPSFKFDYENLKKFEKAFKYFDKTIKYAIEFRHNSWFENEKIVELLKKYNIGMCIVSAPKIKFYPIVINDFAYIRLHGKEVWYKYSYSYNELKQIASIIKKFSNRCKEVWVYFNNDFYGYAPSNAMYLKKYFNSSF